MVKVTRALEMYEGYDLFSMGHIHENSSRTNIREEIVNNSKTGISIRHKHIHSCITGAYKEEYGDGSKGWHIERGAPAKYIGGRIAEFSSKRIKINKKTMTIKQVDSYQFPVL